MCMKFLNASKQITMLGTDTGMTRCVSFSGPRLCIAGAPMWPSESVEEASIFEEISTPSEPASTRKHRLGEAYNAVLNGIRLRKSMVKWRLHRDVANVRMTFDGRAIARHQETRIVVSYGCPSELLATDEPRPGMVPYRGSISLGSKEIYDELDREIDVWIYGSNGNINSSVAKMGNIVCYRNQFISQQGKFESIRPLYVTPKPVPLYARQ